MTSLTAPALGVLCLTPLMIALGQVLFKVVSENLSKGNEPFYTVLFNPFFILAMAIYGTATLMWVYVLKTVPLTYAYSFMALTYILVPLFASLWLGETVTLKYALGAGLIIIGLLVIQS